MKREWALCHGTLRTRMPAEIYDGEAKSISSPFCKVNRASSSTIHDLMAVDQSECASWRNLLEEVPFCRYMAVQACTSPCVSVSPFRRDSISAISRAYQGDYLIFNPPPTLLMYGAPVIVEACYGPFLVSS